MYILCAIYARPHGEHKMVTEVSLGIDDPVGKSRNKDDGKCSVCTGHKQSSVGEGRDFSHLG